MLRLLGFVLVFIFLNSIKARKDELFVGECLWLNKTNDERFFVEDMQVFKKGQTPVSIKSNGNVVSKVVIDKNGK